MKTQQPEQTGPTSTPESTRPPMPTTDVIASTDPLARPIDLTVSERFLLGILLPQKGNRQQMTTCASLERLIAFDEGEALAFGIRYTDEGDMLFNSNEAIRFDLTPAHLELIRQAVDLADSEGRITREMLGLLDKIDSL